MSKFYVENELVFEEKSKHRNFKDLMSQRFHYLTVLGFGGTRRNKVSDWFCKCDCGKVTKVRAGDLKSGRVKSCGCFRIDRTKETNSTHGHARVRNKSSTYSTWAGIIQRCRNPKNCSYREYGGRGISYCKRWKSFENFLKDMGIRPEGMSTNRIDNDGNYCKENCRYAEPKEQANNCRNSRFLTFDNKTQTISQWAQELDMHQVTLWHRINRGWSIEQALSKPVQLQKVITPEA